MTWTVPPLLAAMGSFLNQYPWGHFLTLTFRPPRTAAEKEGRAQPGQPQQWGRYSPRIHPDQAVSMSYALRRWAGFRADLELDAGARLFWFYGVEYGERLGRLHIHALTGNTERVPTRTIAMRWKSGWSRCLVYDPLQGAAGYVSKYITKELAEWDVSDSADEAKKFHAFRQSDRAQVEQLTRAAQARLRGAQRATERTALPLQDMQYNTFGDSTP